MSCGAYLPSWLDCSEAAQDDRKRRLTQLLAKATSGVSSISDRGRSVAYQSPAALKALADDLKKEIAMCDGTYRGARRLSYIDQIKGL
jgi:hypothetical protein